MSKKTIRFSVEPQYELAEVLNGYTIVDSSLGPKGEVCILAVNQPPERIDGMFPPVQTKECYDYKAIILSKGNTKEVLLKNQKWNYHFIQPIDDYNILLVCARSHLYENGTFDRNARVFDSAGNLVRAFLLGDGIQNVFVTEKNNIWTSYFDEGIFGNYGWGQPIGSEGLRCWDSSGNALYQYPNIESHFISDCYALNVISDHEVYFYFYTDFELGRYYEGSIDYIKPDVEGADGFSIYEDYVLFRGGYGNRDNYTLYKNYPGNRLKRKCFVKIMDHNNTVIKADAISCKGSLLLLTSGSKIYYIDIRDILSVV